MQLSNGVERPDAPAFGMVNGAEDLVIADLELRMERMAFGMVDGVVDFLVAYLEPRLRDVPGAVHARLSIYFVVPDGELRCCSLPVRQVCVIQVHAMRWQCGCVLPLQLS